MSRLYKLKVGIHVGPDLQARPRVTRRDPDTREPLDRRYPSRTYKVGEIVESEVDLVAFGGEQKFEYVGEAARRREESYTPGQAASFQHGSAVAPGGQLTEGHPQAASAPEDDTAPVTEPLQRDQRADQPRKTLDEEYGDLNKLSIKELQEIAEEEEIDLKGATRKDEILRHLRAARV